ncbi:anti-sigma-factor antagonist and sugar transfersase [Gloeothece citriformis PCC 7424]|uniref:Anti-sigma-factor antagonist and sugar transfersase n=1 Tax=Gloeothece citriformis (strain PCC 7424) TaxID=65393 RepID=B7KF49_GLOC7|nr:sugar transferase [Gloeothece citriformis]ACK70505.1 anti-sigma-factor antagonist and sugar transfersase [Gloeothece citriformis PCC 7424]
MATQLPPKDFPIVFNHDSPIILIPNRLTVLEAVDFKNTCHDLLVQTSPSSRIILDFSQTQFIDSSGIGALVHNLKATQQQKIELVLYNVQPPIMGVLSLTGLDQILLLERPTASDVPQISSPDDKSLPETHPSVKSSLKRVIDILGSLVGLAITGLLFIPIMLAIKRDSSGPIFFTQTRCGWLGKQFKIIKFRSMCVEAETLKDKIPNQASGAIFKNENDPRVTKVGRFLRRTSLDELPQFWNVLRGEMSLVGTRPPTPDEVDRYDIPQWRRLNIKPGMTGEWQVNGRSQVRNFEDIIELDLRYQKNWSLYYDMELIFKTILILFNKNSGAY